MNYLKIIWKGMKILYNGMIQAFKEILKITFQYEFWNIFLHFLVYLLVFVGFMTLVTYLNKFQIYRKNSKKVLIALIILLIMIVLYEIGK